MPGVQDTKTNAYWLSEIGGQEVERLRKQAAIWLSLELPNILETLPAHGRLVDLGCGIGLLADAAARARPDADVYGFDVDALAAEQSRGHFGGRSNLHFDCRNLEQGPPSGFPLADVAVLRLVLMHISNTGRALDAARAWLKPAGILHVLEGDDRSMSFEPAPVWLPELLALMQAVQKHRGGDRRMGLELPGLLASSKLSVMGQRQFALDPLAMAPAVPQVFLPVAEFYLAEAERLALIRPETIQTLKLGLGQIREGALILNRATIPIFHVWARNVTGVGA